MLQDMLDEIGMLSKLSANIESDPLDGFCTGFNVLPAAAIKNIVTQFFNSTFLLLVLSCAVVVLVPVVPVVVVPVVVPVVAVVVAVVGAVVLVVGVVVVVAHIEIVVSL